MPYDMAISYNETCCYFGIYLDSTRGIQYFFVPGGFLWIDV